MVWQPASWERLRKLPADLNPTDPGDAAPPVADRRLHRRHSTGPTSTVPKGIEVVDQRLEAHGFTAADGVVLEGKVTDLATGQPIAATMRLQRVEPQPKGGYLYPVVAEAEADAQGRWVLKKAAGGLAPRGRRGGRLRAAGRRLRPVRRPAAVAVLRLRPGPLRRRSRAG